MLDGAASGAASGAGKPAAGSSPVRSDVLCVDLDGTLVRTDTLHEYALIAVKARPDVLLRGSRTHQVRDEPARTPAVGDLGDHRFDRAADAAEGHAGGEAGFFG
ncbi:MAG TPA: hypothetical protein PKA74_12325, partial [Bauldia sp.]|nr:hypothetical protein [Bauldia sp.]